MTIDTFSIFNHKTSIIGPTIKLLHHLICLIYNQVFGISAGLGRIAGILSLEVENSNAQVDAIQRVGSELAMHIVAAKPLFLTKELVSAEALENEREILKSQVNLISFSSNM